MQKRNKLMGHGIRVLFAYMLLSVGYVSAQSFEDNTLNPTAPLPTLSTVQLPETVSDKKLEEALTEEQQKLIQEQKLRDVFIPGGGLDLLEKPTSDKSERGGAMVVEINDQGHSRRAEKIFLYYDNFRISSYLKNSVSCDVRFFILSNLDSKITNLDAKLVWPGMTTAVSFSDIAPNTPTYVDYSLIGEGCYSMDKMPNIVVNRCRVKGMSAQECAGKIVWLSMSSAK